MDGLFLNAAYEVCSER